jgi:hypothetical protein
MLVDIFRFLEKFFLPIHFSLSEWSFFFLPIFQTLGEKENLGLDIEYSG